MTPTLKEVAELAGVSTSAVSRAYTEGASVSAKTRAKVEAAAKALGYAPSMIARSLATSRTKLIGLVANNFQNPVFLDVFDLYTRALQARGFRPLLVNLTDVADPSDSARLLRQYSVDGVIVATSTLPPGFAVAFQDTGLKVVHAFGRAARHPPVPVVGVDNVAAGRLAAKTLLARGYRRLAFLGGPKAATSTQDRAAGFVKELAGGAGARRRGSTMRTPIPTTPGARRSAPCSKRRGSRRSSAATTSSAWGRWTRRAPPDEPCRTISASSASTIWRWRVGRRIASQRSANRSTTSFAGRSSSSSNSSRRRRPPRRRQSSLVRSSSGRRCGRSRSRPPQRGDDLPRRRFQRRSGRPEDLDAVKASGMRTEIGAQGRAERHP